MSARHTLWAAALALLAAPAWSQTIYTYSQSPAGPQSLAYGLPVPLPVESLTPVDGFRSHASLEARLQGLAMQHDDLAAHAVGQSVHGRTVWAYVVSDADEADVEGRPEAAFLVNATTHAREWAAPEVATGIVEWLLDHSGERGVVRYLLDNTRLVIIPVQNVDGFLQTQRFPTQAIVGGDPMVSSWPRDGRMRRKNMRGADEVLTTFGDRLAGIDLNRNHPPFWAMSSDSSPNPVSLLFHGAGPHSEPENQALAAAAQLGPATRMRLGIDLHSFARVFYTSNTGRARLNAIQFSLAERMRVHHIAVAGVDYSIVPDPPNRGMGAAAEYFAYQWRVPAWTLELEPQNGPHEYGGLNVEHGGFILPASQVRRVRDGWAETHALAFYVMAGPPHLARIRAIDPDSGAVAWQSRWVYGSDGQRERQVSGAMQPRRRYRVELSFNKPMRQFDAGGEVVALPGLPLSDPLPAVTLRQGDATTPLDVSAGRWLQDPERSLRYSGDSFAFEFTAPDAGGGYALEVAAVDMAGTALDADPSTPADWSAGAWSNWEDDSGTAGDSGGVDRATGALAVGQSSETLRVVSQHHVVGEGSHYEVRIERVGSGVGVVSAWASSPASAGSTLPSPPIPRVAWADGELGVKSLRLVMPDDTEVQGDRMRLQPISLLPASGAASLVAELEVQVLDNDSPTRRVLHTSLGNGLERAAGLGVPLDIVVDGSSREHHFRPQSASGNTTVFGNGMLAAMAPAATTPMVHVPASARLVLDRVQLAHDAPDDAPAAVPLLTFDGELELRRSRVLARASGNSLLHGGGRLSLLQSVVREGGGGPALVAGQLRVESSSLLRLQVPGDAALLSAGASGSRAAWNTVLLGQAGSAFATTGAGGLRIAGNLVQQLQAPALCSGAVGSDGWNLLDRGGCARVGGDRHDTSVAVALDGSADFALPRGAALDAGGDCPPVDQRGAPRPQRSSAGAPLACDAGSVEAGINPYRGIWQPDRSGHGVELHTSGNRLLLVWYTYDEDGQPTSYQAQAQLDGAHWEADLLQPRRDVQSGAVSTPVVGRVTLDFSSDTEATFGWQFDGSHGGGSERIRPSVFAYGEPAVETGGIWYAPVDSGYGLTITRRGATTIAVLYYYDAEGRMRWALGHAGDGDAVRIPMEGFTGFCPDCDATAMPVVAHDGGHLLVHFLTPGRVRLDSQVRYHGAPGGEWIRERASLVPLSDPVDNSGFGLDE